MKFRIYLIIGFLFILAGLLLSSPYLITCHENASDCSFLNTTATRAASMQSVSIAAINTQNDGPAAGMPVHISIPNVDIASTIAPGKYDAAKDEWTIGTDSAYFATMTSKPNTRQGSTFIYGHNLPTIFQNLSNLEAGDRATITVGDGQQFFYEYTSMYETTPDDISMFSYEGSPILTLQTCTGQGDRYRSQFTFKLVNVL